MLTLTEIESCLQQVAASKVVGTPCWANSVSPIAGMANEGPYSDITT